MCVCVCTQMAVRGKEGDVSHFPLTILHVPLAPAFLMSGLLDGKCVSNQASQNRPRRPLLLITAEIKLFAVDEQIKTRELIPITAA